MATKMTYGTSFSSNQWKYDVFLSFCGKDTRKNFTDHLFYALEREGIRTFRDEKELNKGEDISSELMEAIRASRIAIIVFSENYASSTWCLNELAEILKCKNDGQMEKVLPVFYKLDPSDVRHQRNTYEEAFKEHKERFQAETAKVKIWRTALTEVANISGWDQRNVADGHEAELTKKIVDEVWGIVNKTRLDVAEHPIGLVPHIECIDSLLNDGELDVVRIIGIYGPGGIGKTTIAKAIFNELSKKFEGSSFLANVRDVSRQHKGLALLQKQLLSDVLKRKDLDIYNEDQGIILIEERLLGKRVFIILDDVENTEQFYKLVGRQDSFGLGSRIILTTRDRHLLEKLDVDEKNNYRVAMMNQDESLQLFSRHAFHQNHPSKGFEQLSNGIVHYAGGLPLALKVLGSLLYKRSQVEWEAELESLKQMPHAEIFEILKISYDGLSKNNQNIFLDISCFFIGWDKDDVIAILDARILGGEAGIKLLEERSLVTIDEDDRLCMHDLIRDMGREIVRKQSDENPGGRSRLWDEVDAIDVLTNLNGTNAVEGLQLNLFRYNEEEFGPLIIEGFFKMPNLRLLKVVDPKSKITIDQEHSFEERVSCLRKLNWISWSTFPFEYIPDKFYLGNLVILDMRKSKLKQVWKGRKNLPKLKHLILSHSSYLTSTPDFSGLPNLEKLKLNGCVSLVEIHGSINHLTKLVTLDLRDCKNLKNLPSGISKLALLETLDVSYCSKLQNLLEGIGELKILTVHNVDRKAIIELPSFYGLWSLMSLRLYDTKFMTLSSSIGQHLELQTLKLWFSERLKSLPMLPSSRNFIYVFNCTKVKKSINLSYLMSKLSLCEKPIRIEDSKGWICSETITTLDKRVNFNPSVKKKIFQDMFKDNDIDFHGNEEVPGWFGFQSDCDSFTQRPNTEITALAIMIHAHARVNFRWDHFEQYTFDLSRGRTWVVRIWGHRRSLSSNEYSQCKTSALHDTHVFKHKSASGDGNYKILLEECIYGSYLICQTMHKSTYQKSKKNIDGIRVRRRRKIRRHY